MEINCTPTKFESALKTLCERMGLSVQLTRASHDGGVDLNVIDLTPIRGGRYIVQAKRYQGGVGEPTIRDLYGTLLHSGAVKAILITTGYFTESAVAFACGKPIELIDGKALWRLIDQHQLHHEFSGDASSPNSADPLPSVTADELLAEYATKPSDNLLGPILEQLHKEKRYEDVVEFGAPHLEQLFHSASHCSTYFRSLVLADCLDKLPMALEPLWNLHFDYLLQVLVHSVFMLVDRESTQRHFAGVIQTVVPMTESDPVKCRTLAKAYLLLDDRHRSLEWLTKAMQSKPDDPECLCLLAAYAIVNGQYSEALNHLTRSIHAEPNSIAAIHNYHSAKSAFNDAFVQFGDASEQWFLLCMLSEKDLVCLDEVPELKAEVRRSILEEVLKGDPHNLNIREALLSFLPYDQQIALGEELAYEIDEQTNGTRLPTKVTGILQYAYLQQVRENSANKETARARGVQWTEFLIKAGVQDVDTLYIGASLMFEHNDKARAAGFLKDHLGVVLTNVSLTNLYCNCLEHKEAIPILEQVLSSQRSNLSKDELDRIHWALAHHYEESGNPDKAIPLYKLATDFQCKEALTTYLFVVRRLKGNPSAYQEALRLLTENGETLATLYGVSQECLHNDLRVDQIRYLKQAIAIAPNDPDICSDLAFAYQMSDQEEEADYWYKKAALLAGV